MEYPESLGDFVRRLFEWKDFMPHGHCYLWRPEIVWLHAVSDLLIGLSYYSIPLGLLYFILKRKDAIFPGMFALFILFILACGTTHLLSVVTLWKPMYRIDGVVKAVTAVASVLTAILLWPLIPKALRIPSPSDLIEANQKLTEEIGARRKTEAVLTHKKDELEDQQRRLMRFQGVASGREEQMMKLKEEVNALLAELGRPRRYGPGADGGRAS